MAANADISNLLSNKKQALEVPIDHLDYAYVRECTDVPEVEEILRILRSGKEGNLRLKQCANNRVSP
jgi:hypothetical protein